MIKCEYVFCTFLVSCVAKFTQKKNQTTQFTFEVIE